MAAGLLAGSVLTAGLVAFGATYGVAFASAVLKGNPPTPRPKPAAPAAAAAAASLGSSAGAVDANSIQAVRLAFDAAARGDWISARAAQAMAGDLGAKKLISWRITTDRSRAPAFAEIDAALIDLDGYPRVTDLRARGEEQIDFSGLAPANKIAWLERGGGPFTGAGRASLARAYLEAGRVADGDALLRKVWRGDDLTLDQQRRLLTAYGTRLSAADHVARLNLVLWLRDNASAQMLMPLVDSQTRQIADVRMKLRARAKKVDVAVAALPAAALNDPGLMFDRAQWRKSAKGAEDPCTLIAQIDGAAVPAAARGRLWDDLRRCAADAIKAGDNARAYAIVSRHGLSDGEDFADGEFMAGWLALKKLGDPAKADKHFATLEAGVRTPVSKARANYWRALAAQKRGDAAAAQTFFALASQYPTTFYGQIAAQKTAPGAPLSLPPPSNPSDADRAVFEARDLTKAVRILTALGESALFEEFALRLDDQLASAAEHDLLAEIARQRLSPKLAVRSAKSGMRRGIVATASAYPLVAVPPAASLAVEPALALAITRQESEFDQRAVSSAGARGLMQLLPSTARLVARQSGRQYNLAWLTDDPGYNMELGSEYLGSLVNQWGGSYILAIASYNAGPGRARQWVNAYGDPRSPGVDPVDWLETIPIAETRNYVQRVMENLQVYRARLSDPPPPVRIEEDLKRGRWS